jgi:hypothetical protein
MGEQKLEAQQTRVDILVLLRLPTNIKGSKTKHHNEIIIFYRSRQRNKHFAQRVTKFEYFDQGFAGTNAIEAQRF